MEIISLNFPTLTINCVGDDMSIADVRQFFKIQDSKSGVPIYNLLSRMKANKIYGYAKSKKFKAKRIERMINKELKSASLLIDEDDFADAMFVCKPEELSEILKIDEETKNILLNHSIWRDVPFGKQNKKC